MLTWSGIEQEYGIKITEWAKIRDVYRVITQDHGILCLKTYATPESEICFITHVIRHLFENGFAYAPKMILTLGGSPWITCNETHYVLSNWVVGEHPDFYNKKHYKKALRLLAKFHSAAQGISCLEVPDKRFKYNNMQDKVKRYRDILSAYPKTEHLISCCDEAIDHLNYTEVIQAIEQEQAAAAFVHGDYNYPNLVKDTSRDIHMIDFENTSLNVRMQDFAHILHRNLAWEGQETLRWIEYYDRKRPLSREDLHLLLSLLLVPYPVMRRILNKRLQPDRNVLPTAEQVTNYANELKLNMH
jgi:CotS family spore coat protein